NAPIVPYIPVRDVARARKVYEEKVGLKPKRARRLESSPRPRTRESGTRFISPPFCEKLRLELPRRFVWSQGFAAPVKPVCRDVGEGPACFGAVRTRAFLKDVRTVPAADLFLVVPSDGVGPRDPPRRGRRVPCAQGCAIHVHCAIR